VSIKHVLPIPLPPRTTIYCPLGISQANFHNLATSLILTDVGVVFCNTLVHPSATDLNNPTFGIPPVAIEIVAAAVTIAASLSEVNEIRYYATENIISIIQE
jgi:hypothetical protein